MTIFKACNFVSFFSLKITQTYFNNHHENKRNFKKKYVAYSTTTKNTVYLNFECFYCMMRCCI